MFVKGIVVGNYLIIQLPNCELFNFFLYFYFLSFRLSEEHGGIPWGNDWWLMVARERDSSTRRFLLARNDDKGIGIPPRLATLARNDKLMVWYHCHSD